MGNNRRRKLRAKKRAARGPNPAKRRLDERRFAKLKIPKWAGGCDWWVNPDYVPDEPPPIPAPLSMNVDPDVVLPADFEPWCGDYDKRFYDVFLKDGTIIEGVWPNAGIIRNLDTNQDITNAVLGIRPAKRSPWGDDDDEESSH